MTTPLPPPSSPLPPPPPSPHAPFARSGPRDVAPSSSMATAALVCGIVGLVACALAVPSIVALVLGLVAASRAKKSLAPDRGLGRARAGWIMGAVGLTAFAVIIAVAIAAELTDEQVDVDDLDVGECVDVPDTDGSEVQTLDTFDCDEPHDAEVFAVDDLTIESDEYPGDETVVMAVEEACSSAFEAYIGRSYAESELDVYYLYPIERMWEQADDREYACLAITRDGSSLRGSVEGSGR